MLRALKTVAVVPGRCFLSSTAKQMSRCSFRSENDCRCIDTVIDLPERCNRSVKFYPFDLRSGLLSTIVEAAHE